MKLLFKKWIIPLLIIIGIIVTSVSIALLFIGKKKEKLYAEKIDLYDVENTVANDILANIPKRTVKVFNGKKCKYILISFGYVSGVDFRTSFEVDNGSLFVNLERVDDEAINPNSPTFRIYKTNADSISYDDSVVKNPYYTMVSKSGINRGVVISSTKNESLSTISIQPTEDDTFPHTMYEIPTGLLKTIDSSLVSFEYEYKKGYDYPRIIKVINEKVLIQSLRIISLDKNKTQATLELEHGNVITTMYKKEYYKYLSSLGTKKYNNLELINKNGIAYLNPFIRN